MKKSIILMTLSTLALLMGCTPYYLTDGFDSRTATHRDVAVLPFEMVYTGVRPEGLTDMDLQQVEIAESQAFQISFYHEILRSTKSGKKPIRIFLQDHRKTNQILEENGCDIRASWGEDPEKLARMLGVDAIVRGRIEKNRLMSDLASYGLEIAVHILNEITQHTVWPWIPGGITRSKEIRANYMLLDGSDGRVLWSVAIREDADWRQRANDIIDETNRRGARKFPYR